jgi:hypothetical protein
MEKYMNIYENILELLDKKLSIIHPEQLTKANINLYNLKVVRFPMTYYIER